LLQAFVRADGRRLPAGPELTESGGVRIVIGPMTVPFERREKAR